MERTKTLKGGKDAETEGNRTPESAKGVCARAFARMKEAVGEGLSDMARTVAKGTLIATLAVGTACTGPVGDEPEEDADGGGWVINRPEGPGLEIDLCARNPAACPHPDAGEEALDAESEGTEVDTEAGVACEGAVEAPEATYTLLYGTSVEVGGYSISSDTRTPTGIEVDVVCGSSGGIIVENVDVAIGTPLVISVAADNLNLRIDLRIRNARGATADIAVEAPE